MFGKSYRSELYHMKHIQGFWMSIFHGNMLSGLRELTYKIKFYETNLNIYRVMGDGHT